MKSFGPDNNFLAVLNKIVDVMWVSLLWCIVCLPAIFCVFFIINTLDDNATIYTLNMGIIPVCAITVGPASSALYYSIVKVIRRERGYVTKSFFHAFKANFKIGALASLIYGVFLSLMYFDIMYSLQMLMFSPNKSSMPLVMIGLFLCVCGFALIFLVWIYPLLSRFDVGFKELFKNVFIVSVKNLFRTIILVVMYLGLGFLMFEMFMSEALVRFIALLPFFLPGVFALLKSFIIEPVFKKLVNEQKSNSNIVEDEDSAIDEWYTE